MHHVHGDTTFCQDQQTLNTILMKTVVASRNNLVWSASSLPPNSPSSCIHQSHGCFLSQCNHENWFPNKETGTKQNIHATMHHRVCVSFYHPWRSNVPSCKFTPTPHPSISWPFDPNEPIWKVINRDIIKTSRWIWKQSRVNQCVAKVPGIILSLLSHPLILLCLTML